MRVAIFGASGMIGSGVLLECLADPRVTAVLTIGRTATGATHAKVREVIQSDFLDWEPLASEFATVDACFFCLGVSVQGLDEAAYTRLTYDVTLAAARTMAAAYPGMTFCYVSGLGTDSTERGRVMWARIKGRTENALLALFKGAYMFRPGYVQPMNGARSKTPWYQAVYTVVTPAYPLVRRLFPRYVTTTSNIGRAMIAVAARGSATRVLNPPDINRLAEGT